MGTCRIFFAEGSANLGQCQTHNKGEQLFCSTWQSCLGNFE